MSDLADSLQGNYKHILKKTKGNHSLRSEGKSSISGWQSLRTYFLVKLMRNMKGQTLKEIMLNEKCQTKLSTCYNRKCKHYIEKVRWVVAWLCRGVVEEGCFNFAALWNYLGYSNLFGFPHKYSNVLPKFYKNSFLHLGTQIS